MTLLPVNERFPWVTPAKFRPELVPEELMAPCLTVSFKILNGAKLHVKVLFKKDFVKKKLQENEDEERSREIKV